jgi:hypothetical protein
MAEIILAIVLVTFLGAYVLFFYDMAFPVFFVGGAMMLNILFNGSEYHNKTYFLLNFVIVFIAALITLYNFIYLNSINNWFIWIFLAGMVLLFAREYKNRENNPKKPWKNEW